MASAEQPRRGQVWLVSLGAARRGEPGKNRPAIIVSVDGLLTGAEDELIVVVPLSSSRAPSKLRPPVATPEGVTQPSAAIPRAIRAVSRRRLLRQVGTASLETMTEVDRALATVLGLHLPAA